ncbi:uncharacterized protein, partial [Miscanthus floridulus]|uniref:uncharacterized protein n=1 Tax=Miscanthus floridulus TaxID=154761 RepID=UPI00345A7215
MLAEYSGATTEFPVYNMTQMIRHSTPTAPSQSRRRPEVPESTAQQDEIIRGITATEEEQLEAQQERSDPSDSSDDDYRPIPQMPTRQHDHEAGSSSSAPPASQTNPALIAILEWMRQDQALLLLLKYWEDLLCKLNKMRRYMRIVVSLAGSCLSAAIPLLSSIKETTCLVALDVAENATISIAKVEEAYKCECQSKGVIEEAIQFLSFDELLDGTDATEDVDENRLLPAMNKLWPYLVICLRNKISVPVVTKCTEVLSRAIGISGGDFYVRRFHKDGSTAGRLLALSPFGRMSKMDGKAIILPYWDTSLTSEKPMAEISSQKIQITVLDMIAAISSNKRSAVALESVLAPVCGLLVCI